MNVRIKIKGKTVPLHCPLEADERATVLPVRAVTADSFANRDRIKKRHHGSELGAHDLDLLSAFLITEFIHGLATVLIIFVNEALGEFALLNIL